MEKKTMRSLQGYQIADMETRAYLPKLLAFTPVQIGVMTDGTESSESNGVYTATITLSKEIDPFAIWYQVTINGVNHDCYSSEKDENECYKLIDENGDIVATVFELTATVYSDSVIESATISEAKKDSGVAKTCANNYDNLANEISDLKDKMESLVIDPVTVNDFVLGRLDGATDIDTLIQSTVRAVYPKFTVTGKTTIVPNSVAINGNFGETIDDENIFPMTFCLYQQKEDMFTCIGTIAESYTIEDTEAEYRIEVRCPSKSSGSSTPNFTKITKNEVIKQQLFYELISEESITRKVEALETAQYATPYHAKEAAYINAIKAAVDENTIVMTLSTDNHYNNADVRDFKQLKFAKAIGQIAKKVNADFIANLGDMIEGYDDDMDLNDYTYQYINYDRISSMTNAFAESGVPFIYAPGHHEMFPIRDDIDAEGNRVENRAFKMADLRRLTQGEVIYDYQTGFRKDIQKICHEHVVYEEEPSWKATEINSLSFYFDYTKGIGTVRFIVLDGVDYGAVGFSPNTINWLKDALDDAKTNNIPVIIMCHIAPVSRGVMGSKNDSWAKGSKNEDVLNTEVNQAVQNGANILAWFYGHVHHDNVIKTAEDWTYEGVELEGHPTYPLVGFSCQKLYRAWGKKPNVLIYGNATAPKRELDTYTEYSFDTVLIHTDTNTIECYRFGAGDTGVYPTRTI